MEQIEKILAGKYPAKSHIRAVIDFMRKNHPSINGIVYIEGQKTKLIEDNDGEAPFRQRRNFYYITGCSLADSYYIFDTKTQKSILFIPPVDPKSVIWSGLPVSPSEALSLYDVDEVRTSDQLNQALADFDGEYVWAISNQISAHTKLREKNQINLDLLKKAIEECRIVKDSFEVALIRKANLISTIAHHAVFKASKTSKNERELLGLFLGKCISSGSMEQAYSPIVASGSAAATLHYVQNNQDLNGKLNVLLDAGAEYNCYASDITRTFPINGKFSQESREIYDIVLEMQNSCINMLHEGVCWEDVQCKAHEIAIKGLVQVGILFGEEKAIFEARTSAAFFPHGVGHYLGMDTHDTGGNPNFADDDPFFRYLRIRGRLPEGSVVTVEPGLYFCRFIIESYLENPVHARFISLETLGKYWEVGGIRIEDNILITKSGFENLTTSLKSVEELERIQTNMT